MVIVAPGFEDQPSGRQACVDSYRDFSAQATVRDFQEAGHQVDLFGNTAVVSFHYDTTYEMNDEPSTMPGDVFLRLE